MWKLGGFSYRDIIRRIKYFGFTFYSQAAVSHELWFNSDTKRFTTIQNHSGDMPEGTLKNILKQAGISIEEFLKLK